MQYTLTKHKLTRKTIVHYECPHCDEDLKSDLTEAGTEDTCPSCGGDFIVPGADEVERRRRAEMQQRVEADSRKKVAEHTRRAEEIRLTEAEQRERQVAAEQRHDPAYLLNEISGRLQHLSQQVERMQSSVRMIQFAMIPLWIMSLVFVLGILIAVVIYLLARNASLAIVSEFVSNGV